MRFKKKGSFDGSGVGTQGLKLARQMFYHLSHTPSPSAQFCCESKTPLKKLYSLNILYFDFKF
jgi:hypothetical protein